MKSDIVIVDYIDNLCMRTLDAKMVRDKELDLMANFSKMLSNLFIAQNRKLKIKYFLKCSREELKYCDTSIKILTNSKYGSHMNENMVTSWIEELEGLKLRNKRILKIENVYGDNWGERYREKLVHGK